MARARYVKRTRTVQQSQRLIQLEITEGEADLILSLCARVGGHRTKSPRKYARRVREALERALGTSYRDMDAYALIDRGYIHMETYDHLPERRPEETLTPLEEWEQGVMELAFPQPTVVEVLPFTDDRSSLRRLMDRYCWWRDRCGTYGLSR